MRPVGRLAAQALDSGTAFCLAQPFPPPQQRLRERRMDTSETRIYLAMIKLMANRLV
jgi:hypothetical protein